MKPRTRYGLLALLFIVFCICAPLIYMFVTGTIWDSGAHRLIKTGTLSVPTSPRGANIFIDGKKIGTTSATLRFVRPGDYDIRISKDGYFDWTKRLTVKPQYVTSIISDLNQLYLFRNNSARTQIQSGVINFLIGPDKIFYVTADKLYLADASTPLANQELTLPYSFDHLNIAAAPDFSEYLIYNQNFYAVFTPGDNTLDNITAQFANASPTSFQFSSDGTLYAIEGSNLAQIDWRRRSSKAIIPGVSAYSLRDGTIYYMRQNNDGSQVLAAAQAPNYNQSVLMPGLPPWMKTEMYLTGQNQVFILGDGTLYVVSDRLKPIASFVQTVKLYDSSDELMYATNNEVDTYDYFSGAIRFVTRSSKSVAYPDTVPSIGWLFYINDRRLQNIELDNRDHQNNYTFADVGANASFAVSPDGSMLYLLDQGVLTQIQAR